MEKWLILVWSLLFLTIVTFSEAISDKLKLEGSALDAELQKLRNIEVVQKEDATLKQVGDVNIETKMETCKKNLGQIGIALFMYAEDHNGTLPEKLSELEIYIRDIAIMQCPVSSTNIKIWSDVDEKGNYIYTGNKVILKNIQRPDLYIIAYDRPGSHYFSDGGINVLFADGHVDTYNIMTESDYNANHPFFCIYLEAEPDQKDVKEIPWHNKEEIFRAQSDPVVTDKDITSINFRNGDQKTTGITINFNTTGKLSLYKVTKENINKRLAIVLDGKVVSAPVIKVAIPDDSIFLHSPDKEVLQMFKKHFSNFSSSADSAAEKGWR